MPFAWTDLEVRAALGLDPESGDGAVRFSGVTTDSRQLERGQLFVALVGEDFDGHDFVPAALGQGAAAAVVSRSVPADGGGRLYPVEDTLVALGDLARHRRRAHGAPVVGITGSSGKTTTKELTRSALSDTFRVHANPGNLNNRVGLPLTLLATPDEAEVVVLEMGTNEPGEIAELTRIAEPGVGVVTTVSEAHLEKLGSLDGVFEEKLALLDGLGPRGRAVVGDAPDGLPAQARSRCDDVTVVGWTEAADADFRPADSESDAQGRFSFFWQDQRVSLALPGRHAVRNALLALAVARLLDVSPAAAAQGVSEVLPQPLRGELRAVGDLTVLADCYNANPQSVAASLDLLESLPAGAGRVAVLGTMLELGDRSEALHREVLEDALRRSLDLVVATGGFATAAHMLGEPLDRDRVVIAQGPEEAYERLSERLTGREAVLLKASRGVALERLLPLFERDFGSAVGGGA